MSKYLEPTLYKGRASELQWMNLTITGHDMICGCREPIKHLHGLLKKENHQLCLPSTEDHGQDGDVDGDHFGPGDLDKLFEEDFTEDDG